MSWKIDKSKPISPQLCEQICVKIARGEFAAGQKMSSVREVALKSGVNPNTVQKAFEQLEQTGLIHSVRSSGWFVSQNTKTAEEMVNSLIRVKTAAFFKDMEQLGLTREYAKKYIEEWYNE